jgi:glutamine cyclotransferase
MRHVAGILLIVLLVGGFSCRSEKDGAERGERGSANNSAVAGATPQGAASVPAAPTQKIPTYGYEVVNTWRHDMAAFTQGLIFHDGALLESTGQNGSSSLRRVELKTGKVLQKIDVPAQFFAEGMTLFGGKIYQLTWQNHKGFIYDPKTFEKQGEFRYDGEGWGLTHDGESLILSDGTNQIRFLDPGTFEVKRTISVYDRGQPLRELNELEYVKGEIYSNIWHTDQIVRIDPRTGRILGWINLSGLIAPGDVRDPDEAVLNGIAYDEAGDRLFVTGKLWPKLFEIRLKEK